MLFQYWKIIIVRRRESINGFIVYNYEVIGSQKNVNIIFMIMNIIKSIFIFCHFFCLFYWCERNSKRHVGIVNKIMLKGYKKMYLLHRWTIVDSIYLLDSAAHQAELIFVDSQMICTLCPQFTTALYAANEPLIRAETSG